MNLYSIKQGLFLQHSITRYNRRYDTRLNTQHLRIMFILRAIGSPCNRWRIISILAARSISVNYNQLNRVMIYLLKEKLIQLTTYRKKHFQINVAGIEVLTVLEKWTRRMRLKEVIENTF